MTVPRSDSARVVELLDERDCGALLRRYCFLIDSGHASGVADLFSPAGMWMVGDMRATGEVQLRAAFERREAARYRISRHVLTNVDITVDRDNDTDGDRAVGHAYLSAYRHDRAGETHAGETHAGETHAGETHSRDGHSGVVPVGLPVMVGDIRAEFAREAGRWRIMRMETVPVFTRDDRADVHPGDGGSR